MISHICEMPTNDEWTGSLEGVPLDPTFSDCGLLVITPWKRARFTGHAIRASASKTFNWNSAGWTKISDYDQHREVSITPAAVRNLTELAQIIEVVANADAYLVRGALTQHGLDALTSDDSIFLNRRKLANCPGDKPSLQEADRRWVMLDVDGWPVPHHLALYDVDDHEAIIDAMIRDVLHPCFQDVRCFYQFSASCGLVDSNVAKAHLWFWIGEPTSNDRLRQLCIQQMPGVDYAPFNAVQPHYVSPPKLIGGHDPLPSRMGWREAGDDVVYLPLLPATEAKGLVLAQIYSVSDWTDPLRMIGDGEGRMRFYGAIRCAIWRYVSLVRRGGTRNDTMVTALIAKAVARAPRSATRSLRDIELYMNEVWLRRQIEAAFRKQAQQQGGLS